MAEETIPQKKCTKCGETKPASEFHSRGRQQRHLLRRQCKACHSLACKRNAIEHPRAYVYDPEKRRENYLKHLEYYQEYGRRTNTLKREDMRERLRHWRERNRERNNEYARTAYWKDPERAREAARLWGQNNKGKVNARTGKRRAAKRQATPSWADEEAIRAIYDEAARLTAETGTPHHVDHIVPLKNPVVCGLHVPCNLQVLPAAANLSKHNRLLEIWLNGKR